MSCSSRIRFFFQPAFLQAAEWRDYDPERARTEGRFCSKARFCWWRRERDSNPRYAFWAYTRFPVVLLQPARTSLRIIHYTSTLRFWRRGWDSNPRSRHSQDTAFRERGLQPLGHLSGPKITFLTDYVNLISDQG